MSTKKKLRLGVVMAALNAAVGGTALGAAPAAAWAETGLSTTPAAPADASAPAPITESFATTAVYDWQ